MRIDILTLFPEMFGPVLGESVTGRALEKGIFELNLVNIRDFTLSKHNRVDDAPYGGGSGMIMQVQPLYDAYRSVADENARVIYLTPHGETFTQKKAKELSREERLIFICGHYEGIDERVLEEIVTDEVSLGDFVLTGGELPAIVMIDCISRLLPGVLNNDDSAVTESFSHQLLEYPQYTRPDEWHGKRVPEVLLSGAHKEVNKWRLTESEKRTKEKRPDLYEAYMKEQKALEILKKQKASCADMMDAYASCEKKIVGECGEYVCMTDAERKVFLLYAPDASAAEKALALIQNLDKEKKGAILFRGTEAGEIFEKAGYQMRITYTSVLYTRGVKLKGFPENLYKNEVAGKINAKLEKGRVPYFLIGKEEEGMLPVYDELELIRGKKTLAFYTRVW